MTTVKTIQGKPISEDQVDTWGTEAENGYEIESYFLAGENLAIQNTPLGRKALTPLVHQTAHFKPRP